MPDAMATPNTLPVHIVLDLGVTEERPDWRVKLPCLGQDFVRGITGYPARRYRHVETVERVIVDRGRLGWHVRYGLLRWVSQHWDSRGVTYETVLYVREANHPDIYETLSAKYLAS